LAGAAHLLHINAGVLRQAQIEQKSIVEHKGKSLLDSRSSVPIHGVKAWPNDPLVSLLFKGRSRRWQKNYHRDNWLVAAKRS